MICILILDYAQKLKLMETVIRKLCKIGNLKLYNSIPHRYYICYDPVPYQSINNIEA